MISDLEVFDYFKQGLREEVLTHPIIKRNKYLWWFSQTELDKEDIIYFTKQFSVFSNQFMTSSNVCLLSCGFLYRSINQVRFLYGEKFLDPIRGSSDVKESPVIVKI